MRTRQWTNKAKDETTLSIADSLVCGLYTAADEGMTISISRSSNYAAGQLQVTSTNDEDGNVSYEFKDAQERVVLTRAINGSEIFNTYYIYDRAGNLRAVLPPKAADVLVSGTWTETNQTLLDYAYLYKYDTYRRCVEKKLPSIDWIYYIYDRTDTPIFTQDGIQRMRSEKEWSFSLTDELGRIALTGIGTNVWRDQFITILEKGKYYASYIGTQPGGPVYMGYSGFGPLIYPGQVLTVNYYDDYDFKVLDGFDDPNLDYDEEQGAIFQMRHGADASIFENRERLTGTATAILDENGVAGYVYTAMYYDKLGQMIQSKSVNSLTGILEQEYVAYDFTGQTTNKRIVHVNGDLTTTEDYSHLYDHAGRLLVTRHRLNGGTEVVLDNNEYDELGRLKTNKRNGNTRTDYTYNIRSWTKTIDSPQFRQTLYYNDAPQGVTPRFNGNISAMDWSANETKTRRYAFAYDQLSRLTAADYSETNGNTSHDYSTAYTYGKHGSPTHILRHGPTAPNVFGIIDNVTLTYQGNQLRKAEDTAPSPAFSTNLLPDFRNNSTAAVEYTYDANGNRTSDLNQGITEVKYNALNLPCQITANGETKRFVYSAGGEKLRTLTNTTTVDYSANVVYENNAVKRVLIDGGYIENGQYYFYLTDHLGNNRIVTNAAGTVVQANHYYPYGMTFPEGLQASQQPYKFGGKEKETWQNLGSADFEARIYQPALAEFDGGDPMMEKYYAVSPYAYCAGNPISRVDPDGRDWYIQESTGRAQWFDGYEERAGYIRVGPIISYRIDEDTWKNAYQNATFLSDKPMDAFDTFYSNGQWAKLVSRRSSILSDRYKTELLKS
ncbi:MAG: hypothetical protein LBN29_08670, partial [Mediterranea sp.]|nr:hypothetical protein [Mediterranea sp.]